MASTPSPSAGPRVEGSGVCGACGASNAIHRCARCQISWYCSSTCQTADWPLHKRVCARAAVSVRQIPEGGGSSGPVALHSAARRDAELPSAAAAAALLVEPARYLPSIDMELLKECSELMNGVAGQVLASDPQTKLATDFVDAIVTPAMVARVAQLLARGANPNSAVTVSRSNSSNGVSCTTTALACIASTGSPALFAALTAQSRFPLALEAHCLTMYGSVQSVLSCAIASGSVPLVDLVLKAGADVHSPACMSHAGVLEDGKLSASTLFDPPVARRAAAMLPVLLAHGFDVNRCVNAWGDTLLSVACNNTYDDVALATHAVNPALIPYRFELVEAALAAPQIDVNLTCAAPSLPMRLIDLITIRFCGVRKVRDKRPRAAELLSANLMRCVRTLHAHGADLQPRPFPALIGPDGGVRVMTRAPLSAVPRSAAGTSYDYLLQATSYHLLPLLEFVLANGVSAQHTTHTADKTPLVCVAINGAFVSESRVPALGVWGSTLAVMQCLMRHGASPRTPDAEGDDALHVLKLVRDLACLDGGGWGAPRDVAFLQRIELDAPGPTAVETAQIRQLRCGEDKRTSLTEFIACLRLAASAPVLPPAAAKSKKRG